MNPSMLTDLVKTVMQKNSLQDCSIPDLQRITDKYPYFSIAQLLLTLKLAESDSPGYTSQLQKLSLYIQDPLWVEQLLEQKGDMVLHPNKPENVKESPKEEVLPVSPDEASIEANEEVTSPNEIAPASPVEVPMQIREVKFEPMNASTSELTFEPYHTVDYFASQGIRMKEEDMPKDKFGLQLKSFTEWLKTMRKLPVAEIPVNVDRGSEQKVEQMAQHSITEREIVTEAMAEVWEKQGNMEKAIATYRKLSLLNPSKSSYFAAKIEQLKTI